ncbi:DUF3857 domain-containing protein [Aestuariibaculum sp. YM273]|uniref:DUF3857 domain-containing protein n=1 Tax=Aestuariibaculum sp. YM273 TaxID=3070659 RepID=UPI0027DDE89C|nr:DUF3857 domain-containing protein [Aestuariibaculum sp. YM273]WMI65474.1 DUF3857 domain-containing protein [Aestuariibaculum sp. YM273]
MTRIILCSFLFFIFSSATFAQNTDNTSVFRVSLKDLKMTAYPQDSTANALVLYESGKSYVSPSDYKLYTEEKHKIKIFNKEGFDHANITINLYHSDRNSFEQVEDIIATTYTLDGDQVITTKLNKKDIHKIEYDENHHLAKFTLPNVKVGSVITYSYTTVSPFMFKYHGWEFQGDLPKLYSEYNASIPANWKYNIKLVGSEKLFVNESDIKKDCLSGGNGGQADCSVSKYAMKNIPAFIEEDYMTCKSNYLARIDYELQTFEDFRGITSDYSKTWETVDDELKTDKNIGRQILKSVDVENLLSEDIINETNLSLKAKAIYDYVQEQYTWNGDYKIFRNVSVKELIKEKSGNVSSINILLHNLLETAGISVKPVLLSTRNNGFATKLYPVISDFNYLIVQAEINGKTYLLDATDKYLYFGQLPFRCLNQYGRLLDFENGSKWIDINEENTSSILYSVSLQLNPDETMSGDVKIKKTGYYALNSKKDFFINKSSYESNLKNKLADMEISEFNVEDGDINGMNFSENFKLQYGFDQVQNSIYLNPFIIAFFNENPFKLQERTYPIDFGFKDSYLYILKLNIGDNYNLVELPDDINVALPNNSGRLNLSSKVFNNEVHMLMRLNFNSSFYPTEYYPYLKEFMNKIVNTQKNTMILLQKS